MPLCPQVTITPITVTSTNMVQSSVIAANVPATTEQLTVTDAAVALAQAEAAAAAAASATALQVSTNTIVNASNQLTAINGNGITVYAGASSISGARVILNSAGLAGFNASDASTFAINASNGNVSVTGTINATAGYFGTPTNGFSISSTGLVGVGSGLISGGSITGATITGGTIQTSVGSSAVILNGASNAIQFKSGGNVLANLVPLGVGGLLMHYGTTPEPSGGAFPQIYLGSANISLNVRTGGGSINTIAVSGDSVTFTGTTYANNAFYVLDSSISTAAPNGRIDSDGRVRRTTGSSIRFKDNVVDLSTVTEMLPSKLLELPVRAFKFKADYLDAADNRVNVVVPGFIAEEVDEHYPSAADYDIDGVPENWNERFIIPGMLALIQDLYKQITLLKGE